MLFGITLYNFLNLRNYFNFDGLVIFTIIKITAPIVGIILVIFILLISYFKYKNKLLAFFLLLFISLYSLTNFISYPLFYAKFVEPRYTLLIDGVGLIILLMMFIVPILINVIITNILFIVKGNNLLLINKDSQKLDGQDKNKLQQNLIYETLSAKKIIILIILSPFIMMVFLYASMYLFMFLGDALLRVNYTIENIIHPIKNVAQNNIELINTDKWKTIDLKYLGISLKHPENWHAANYEYISATSSSRVNKINIYTYNSSVNPVKYSIANKEFEKIKSEKINKVFHIVYDDKDKYEYNDWSVIKIREGKINSKYDFVSYVKYQESYAEANGRPYAEYKSLNTYIKNNQTIYSFVLEVYDNNGENIFHNLIQTVKLSDLQKPYKFYDNGIFSFKYPIYVTIDPEAVFYQKNGFSFDPGLNSDFDFWELSQSYSVLDPNKYTSADYRQVGSWQYELICNYFHDYIYDIFEINGYQGFWFTDEDLYVINKPYIVHFTMGSPQFKNILEEIYNSIKFKTDNINSIDKDAIEYTKINRGYAETVCIDRKKEAEKYKQ
ncbi:MAG: hypothetical protein A2171_00455 [Candidatus Levybacteria bacterium RBG_13_35_9]|nr:MAG: hypothetical protein A2171_00455 [Candidatus Levybacteria bacterium RBG_13_35_9]